MKKLFFAVLILSVLVSCKDEKLKDPFGPKDPDPLGIRGGAPKDAARPDGLGPAEADVDENGFKIKPHGHFDEDISVATCLWCGNVIDATIKSRIILNPGDQSKTFPGARINPEFSNAHFCGLKCFNDFKKIHLNNTKTEIAYNDSTKVYSILISK
jgi:hypothetical protein